MLQVSRLLLLQQDDKELAQQVRGIDASKFRELGRRVVLDQSDPIPPPRDQGSVLRIEALAEQGDRLAPDDAPAMQAFGPAQQIARGRGYDAG